MGAKTRLKRFFLPALIFLGIINWSLIMVKSALIYPFGMGFWGPNGHDGVWHIALINQLARGSLEMPTFAGEQLGCGDGGCHERLAPRRSDLW